MRLCVAGVCGFFTLSRRGPGAKDFVICLDKSLRYICNRHNGNEHCLRGPTMTSRNTLIAGIIAAALPACATQPPAQTEPVRVADPNSALEPCIAQAMEFMVGTWDYTGVVARISGPSRTFVTRSKHWNTDMENTWSGQAFGGDITEEEPDQL